MKRSNTEIEGILNSLDGMERAEARPFMHTRVMAALREENNAWNKTVNFLAKPVVAIACLVAVLAGNAYTLLTAQPVEPEPPQASVPNAVSDVLQNDNYILAVNDVN